MKSDNKIYSGKQERMIADILDWEVVSGSGARFQPGDIISDTWLGECKTHTRPGNMIEFRSDYWDKIYKESISQMKRPAYFVDDGSQTVSRTWVMTTWLPLDNVKVIEYPGREVRKVFSFQSSNMSKELIKDFNCAEDTVVFELSFNGDTVWLTRLDMFSSIVGML